MINQARLSTNRSRRRFGAGLLATALAAVGVPLAATPASALVISSPPTLPHSIISFPARDFVSASGYAAGDRPTVQVVRAGIVVGIAHGVVPADDTTTAGFDGLVAVNHPGGSCWEGVTPSIRPGDKIQVLNQAGTAGDETTTANVTVTKNAATTPAGTVTMHGTAVSAAGGQIPIDQLEIRIIANKQSFAVNGKRAIRAASAPGGEGSLVYDGAATTWTATFTGLDAGDTAMAVGGESRVLWRGINPASGQEATIFESGGAIPAAKGPAAPCTAPAASGPSVGMATASDTGLSSSDRITNRRTPTFTGTTGLSSATSVNLYADGALVGSSGVNGTGGYSITSTVLAPGGHRITAGEVGPGLVDPAPVETMGNAPVLITIDTTAPAVTGRAPAVNATGVRQINNLSATFGEKVFGVTNASFTLKKVSPLPVAAVAAAVSYNAITRVATLNPTATLAPGTRYTASLTSGIKDVAGNPLTATSWSFSTGPRPTVIRKTPAANALGVSRVANATATFSENVGGVSSTTFKLKRTSTGAAVTVAVTYNATTHVATMNPSVTLAANTKYTATLAPAAAAAAPHIHDADGNLLATLGWSFTTGR